MFELEVDEVFMIFLYLEDEFENFDCVFLWNLLILFFSSSREFWKIEKNESFWNVVESNIVLVFYNGGIGSVDIGNILVS